MANSEMNASWQNWILGIVAVLFSALIVSAISFRSDTNGALREHNVLLKLLEQRIDRLERVK